jgi:hypothetical protein
MKHFFEKAVMCPADDIDTVMEAYSTSDNDGVNEVEWYHNFLPKDAVNVMISTINYYTIWELKDGTFCTVFGFSKCSGTLYQCIEFLKFCACEPYDKESLKTANITHNSKKHEL